MKRNIQNILDSFEGHFYERDEEIRGALLAILANENILYLGPPGTAKTYLAQNICNSVDNSEFFYYLLTRFTTPEEVFGPLSLKGLENDEFKRKTDGCLPTANIALLDEIFKANSSILNSLLTLLNERKFHNGTEVIDTPLLTVFGASNELPEEDENLEALYDRFLFRYDVGYIQNEENLRQLLFQSNGFFKPKWKMSIVDIKNLQRKAEYVTFYPDVINILMSIRKKLNNNSDEDYAISISDRRWKKIVNVLKVAAAANGYDKVNRSMLLILQHMLWDVPEQKEPIKRIIYDLIASGGYDSSELESNLNDLKEDLEDENNYSFERVELPETVIAQNNTRYNSYGRYNNAGLSLVTSKGLYENNIKYSNALYCLKDSQSPGNNINSNSTKSYSYSALIDYFRSKYDFSLNKKLDDNIALDLKEAEKSFKNLEIKATKHFDHLIRDLENNIWISIDNINEMKQLRHHYLHEVKKTKKLLNEVKSVKGPKKDTNSGNNGWMY